MGTVLKIKWAINESGKETIDLEDLGLSEEEWNDYSSEEKDKFIQELFGETDLELIPTITSWTEIND